MKNGIKEAPFLSLPNSQLTRSDIFTTSVNIYKLLT